MSIVVDKLSYAYGVGMPFEQQVLHELSFTIGEGEFVGIIGHTGSGKSTLVQHLNGLIALQRGSLVVDGVSLGATYDKQALRKRVGMVFQYPEYQLFEETVKKDIAFGPKNMGLSEAEQDARVRRAMEQMELSYEEFASRSPFDLSGGQKRRVAIAGVLAMQPQYLVLDEPAAGLDPEGRTRLLARIRTLHEQTGNAVIMVSHSMDDIAACAQRVLVLHEGRLVREGTPQQVFEEQAYLREIGLGTPLMAQLCHALKEQGVDVPFAPTPAAMAAAVAQALEGRHSDV